MAGAEGLEPSTKVLETHVLPLHHAPTRNKTDYTPENGFVKEKIQIPIPISGQAALRRR